jgi:O-antigen/teichoic acid export membrane protein
LSRSTGSTNDDCAALNLGSGDIAASPTGGRGVVFGIFQATQNVFSRYGTRALIQTAIAIANFVLLQVLARILDTAEFGLYSLVLSANALVLLLFFQPITDGINRFRLDATRAGHHAEFRRAVVRLMLSAAALVCASYLLIFGINREFPLLPRNWPASVACVTLIYFLLSSFGAVAITYFNAGARYGWCFFVACFAPAASAWLVIVLGRFEIADTFTVIAVQSVVWAAILAIVAGARLRQLREIAESFMHPRRPAERAFTSGFMKFVWSIPPLSLAAYAFMFGDRIMVAKFFPLREVGQYSYMFVLTTSVVAAAYSIFATSTYLHAIEQLSRSEAPRDEIRTIRNFIRVSLLFPVSFAPLIAIYEMFDQKLVRFLFGSAASVPPGCLALLLIAATLNYGAQQVSIAGNLLKRQQTFILPRWVLIGCLFSALAVYHPSLYGVSVVVLCVNAGQFVITLMMVYQMQRDWNLRSGFKT